MKWDESLSVYKQIDCPHTSALLIDNSSLYYFCIKPRKDDEKLVFKRMKNIAIRDLCVAVFI